MQFVVENLGKKHAGQFGWFDLVLVKVGLAPKIQLWMVPIQVDLGTVKIEGLLLIYWEKKASQRLKGIDVKEKQ